MLTPLILTDCFEAPMALPIADHGVPEARKDTIRSSISDDHVIVIGSLGASKGMRFRYAGYAGIIRLVQAEKSAAATIPVYVVRGYAHV